MSTDSHLKMARRGCAGAVVMVLVCVAAALLLWKLRPRPQTRPPREPVVSANLITASATNVVVTVTAHGVARPVRRVRLTSEVSGRIADMPRTLHAGDRVAADELLVRIDDTDTRSALREAEAAVERIRATLAQLDIQDQTDRKLLQTATRSRDLARADADRLRRLSEEGRAVSTATAEAAERTLAQAESQVLQLEQSLALIPARTREAESQLAAANAALDRARTHQDRTRIHAPFAGRVTASHVERDEVLAPGSPVVDLADDSVLEIRVPVPAGDLRAWIPFQTAGKEGWFPPLQPVDVSVHWTGSDREHSWTGRLDRVVEFDATTRTATLAIRVEGDALRAAGTRFPLSDGMFCRVGIPGRTLENVIALPRAAVTFDRQAYLSVDGHLKTVGVEVVWSDDRTVYVTSGVTPGDLVVGSRLVAPLEGVKLVDSEP